MTSAIACAVCFGQSDAPMAVATNAGIWMMLGVVAAVLASFASFFIYLNRRAKIVAGDGPAANSGSGRTSNSSLGTNPQEGTAQC